jgi:hypothetical protein
VPSVPLEVASATESPAPLPIFQGPVTAPQSAPGRVVKKRAAPQPTAQASVAASPVVSAPEKTSLGELVIDETEFGAAARGK